MAVLARRKWLRCKVNIPVRVKALNEKNKRVWTGKGVIINLGGGGGLFDVPGLSEELIENLVSGKYKIQLAVELPNIFCRTKIRAKVVWVEESENIPQRIGLAFEDIPEEKEARVVDYVEKRLSGESVNHAFKHALEKWLKVRRKGQ